MARDVWYRYIGTINNAMLKWEQSRAYSYISNKSNSERLNIQMIHRHTIYNLIFCSKKINPTRDHKNLYTTRTIQNCSQHLIESIYKWVIATFFLLLSSSIEHFIQFLLLFFINSFFSPFGRLNFH